jgi:hypothetical protein
MTPQQEEKSWELQRKLVAMGFSVRRAIQKADDGDVPRSVVVIAATQGSATKVVMVEWDGSTW